MGSTFPNGIASFRTHRDRIDDVSAADINKIQDEVLAIEATLGDALTTIQVIEGEVVVLQSEEATNENTDSSLIQRFNNLKDLINALWEGRNIYAAEASVANKNLPASVKDRPFPPALVQLGKPSTDNDPSAMWNGTGFTLKKGGFWVCSGHVDVGLRANGATNTTNFGTYEASVTINGTDWTRALDRRYPQVDETWHDVVLAPTFVGWLPKGTRITLRAAQSSGHTQHIVSAHLSVYRVRGR